MDRCKRHPLINIITISICAIIGGCDDFCSIEEYGKSKQEWFAEFLDLPHGIPSHDTFCDVLNRLNPNEFAQAFTHWVSQLGKLKDDIVALDGKVMRGTLDKANGNLALTPLNGLIQHIQWDKIDNSPNRVKNFAKGIRSRQS